MTTSGLYDLNTGLLTGGTTSPALTNQKQIDAFADIGMGHVIIPDGKNAGTGMIDLDTGQYIDYAPKGIDIPSLWVQLTAALVKNNVISADDLHPATVIEINSTLANSNMAVVNITK